MSNAPASPRPHASSPARLITALLACLLGCWLPSLPAHAGGVSRAANQARQAAEASSEAPSNRAAARSLAEKLVACQPAIRTHQVHWVLGVDVSGSMDALIPALTSTLGSLSHDTMRPRDCITLYAFDDEIRRFPHDTDKRTPETAGQDAVTLSLGDHDREAQFFEQVRRNIRVRPGHRGTQVDACFRRLFEHAARIATQDRERIPMLLLITDRDTDDGGISPHDLDLSAYVKQFGASPQSQKAYASDSLKLDAGGKSKEVVLLYSALRSAAGRESASLDRQKPVEPPRVVPIPASDPSHHLRLFLRWLPLPLALLAMVAGAVTWRTPYGRLVAQHQDTAAYLSWHRPSLRLPASRNAEGIALSPTRSGLAEPLVLEAGLHTSDLRRGAVRLAGIDPYLVRDEQGLWEREVLLPPRRPLEVRVRDSHGEVARGELEWCPEPRWRQGAQATLALLLLALLSLPADYLGQTHLTPPTPESSRSIREESL